MPSCGITRSADALEDKDVLGKVERKEFGIRTGVTGVGASVLCVYRLSVESGIASVTIDIGRMVDHDRTWQDAAQSRPRSLQPSKQIRQIG